MFSFNLIKKLNESEELKIPLDLKNKLYELGQLIAEDAYNDDNDYYISFDDMDSFEDSYNDKFFELIQQYIPELEDIEDEDYHLYDSYIDELNSLVQKGISEFITDKGYIRIDGAYSQQNIVEDKYYEIINWLRDNNVLYKTSNSTNAGLVPSIYIINRTYFDKDSNEINDNGEFTEEPYDYDDEVVYRIANHHNHNTDSYNYKLYEISDYVDWQNNILPDIEDIIDRYPNTLKQNVD